MRLRKVAAVDIQEQNISEAVQLILGIRNSIWSRSSTCIGGYLLQDLNKKLGSCECISNLPTYLLSTVCSVMRVQR